MADVRNSDTIVIQTFRKHDIPGWVQRCLDSVRNWAGMHGHDYSLAGDEFYALCGPDYLARGRKDPRTITDLARLVATRNRLDDGYRQVIWMDADVFVFDPERLDLSFPAEALPTGYAFGREVWLQSTPSGEIRVLGPMAHNAATFFTQAAIDLDMLISLIRHIDAGRSIVNCFQVGVGLLRGLQYSLMFPTFSHVSVLSPDVLRAIAEQNETALRVYGRAYRFQCCAGNLCFSIQNANIPAALVGQAMDRLEAERGEDINKYATEARLALMPYGR